ncbi:MAG: hypothetical protein ABII22_04565 [Candidatus Micrarchaeota archaeon]
MKLRVAGLDDFLKECKERQIKDVRVATLFETYPAKTAEHTLPMISSKTVATAIESASSDLIIRFEKSNGAKLNFDHERKEICKESEESEKKLIEDLGKAGFSVKQGIFEL